MILTQQQLILALRGLPEPVRVCSVTIHAWIRSGMPTVPGWKKPRFILAQVLAWLEHANEVDPMTMDVRDRLYLRNIKRAA